MGGESPVVEIYDSNGTPLAVQNGVAIPANTPALIAAGSDGTNSRYLLVDSSGRPVMVGAGTAGSPSGGVVSIQGVASGTVVPVSGTIGATQNGNIDAGNSTTTPLAGSGTFSGTSIDVSVYGVITVFVFADQAGTLNLEFSINGTNWDDVNSYAVSASTALSVQFGPQARFFRVVYQNGGSAQSVFRLQTIERPITAFPETVPASYVIQNNDDVLLTKTVQGTSPWVSNITQFGSNNVVTGTGGSGVGIPRVTVSNDSNILATQSGSWTVTSNQGTSPWVTNITQFGGNNVVTGTGAGGIGIPRVTVSNDSNVLVTQSTSPWVDNITQFGGTNISTGTGTSGAGIPRVTVSNDSNILATQSGTWTVAQGAPNSNANKWPVQVTDGTHNMPTMDAIARAGFQEITDGTNGPVAVKAASTAAVAADPSLVVALSPNSPTPATADVTATGALNALNAAVTITHPGLQSVGFQLASGTLAATLVAECSFDGGTTWNATYFKRSSDDTKFATIGLINPNSAQAYTILTGGGAGQTRVRVSVFTSGTANATLRASDINDVQPLYSASSGAAIPPSVVQIGGNNANTMTAAVMKSSSTAAAVADASLVVALSPNSPLPTGTNNIGSVNYEQTTESTAAWTSSTTVNTTLAQTITGYGTVTVTFNQGSTITGGVVTFEVSDTVAGTNWYPISMISSAGATVPSTTYTLQQSTNASYQTNVAGYVQFRVRLSTVISGTGTVNVGIAANASATEWQQATYITDATHGPVAVKPSSTAAATGDPALVVTISPNSAALQITNTSGTANTGVSFGRVLYGGTSGVLTAVRATAYTEQTTNFTGSVKSSSTSDTNSAGTGARSITITYYDQTGAGPFTESANLNGTTAVNLVNTNHCFIEKIVVTTVGSTGSNQGTISLFTGAAGAGTTVGTIGVGNQVPNGTVGDNTTLWAHHYTPINKTSSYFLFNVGTTGNQTANHFLKSQQVLTANSAEIQITDSLITAASSDSVSRDLVSPAKVTGFARTTAYVVSNGTNTNFFAGFDFSDA